MKENKKKNFLLFTIIGILLLIIGIIIFYIVSTENKKVTTNNLNFEILYNQYTYAYKIKININLVQVKKFALCKDSITICGKEIKENNYLFKNKNAVKLLSFINNNFETNKEKITIDKNSLNDYQNNIINNLILGEQHFELAIEPYKYKLIYNDATYTKYHFYFKDDNSILMKKAVYDTLDVLDNNLLRIETQKIDFDKKNINILFNYIKKQKLNKENTIERYQTIYKDETSIFNSLINNNESYLKNYDSEPKLAYIITYNGINCPTPTIRLYDDNTYELLDTYTTTLDMMPSIKSGKYDYDIEKIIKGIINEPNNAGPYYITDKNGKEYTSYDNNTALMEFFKSTDISINKCLTEVKKELLFTVESHMLKCPSPTLKVYNDNTYELYGYPTVNQNKENLPTKSGRYKYDINTILNNLEANETLDNFNIILTDKYNQKHYLMDYKPLDDFLSSINIKIHTCG